MRTETFLTRATTKTNRQEHPRVGGDELNWKTRESVANSLQYLFRKILICEEREKKKTEFPFLKNRPIATRVQSSTKCFQAEIYVLQVALTLHGFTLHGSHFTRGLCFCQMNSHYVVHYTFSSLCTIKKILFEY